MRLFYRMVDSDTIEGEDRVKIRECERRTFEAIKNEAFKEEWVGSLDQNLKADKIVAEKIRNSLKFYEAKVKSNSLGVSYFTFK